MSSSFDLRARPSGRGNGGSRGRGRGSGPRAGASHQSRPAQPQVAYGRDSADSNNGEMNAHLSERIVSSRRPEQAYTPYSGVPRNPLVEQFERAVPITTDGGEPSWRDLPEVPSSAELMSAEVDLPCNEVDAPWPSVEEYLGAHYELLREDSFSPLRDAVGRYRANPLMDDEHNICIYENCRIVGITFAQNIGACVKLSFSTNRARKRIRWDNSKRLCPGTLVAMTTDDFDKVVRVATVAARPRSGLEGELPYGTVVDLLFLPDELEIDPTKTWHMVEARNGYFEAYKHTLKALQRMGSSFPLSNILTLQKTIIGHPKFLSESPTMDLTACFNDHPDVSTLQAVNVIQKFPSKKDVTTSMDESQMEAVQRIVSKELAIVQGPPGCGKTFVSVKALAAMISNRKHQDPPIIVACQTNHALDQLLRYVIEFEPNVIRLGGRTQDTEKIKERTLYNVRQKMESFEVRGSGYGKWRSTLRRLELKGKDLLDLLSEQSIIPDNLLHFGIITQTQRDSFHKYTEDWVKLSPGNVENAIQPMTAWIGNSLLPILRREDIAFEYEEEDIGVEELRDLEAEFNDEFDGELKGVFSEFQRFKRPSTRNVTEEILKKHMTNSDVWKIPENLRGNIYARWEKTYTAAIQEQIRKVNKDYANAVAELKISRWERDAYVLKRAKVIGMTTTGVSKYRSLVAALEPRICLIEEAAETLEGPLIAACYPSIQQLILVGDHKQLKGHCNVTELEKAPYNLSMSMFERLVNNEVEFTRLNKQRRMRPEIRAILDPIYEDLSDDAQVLNRPPIPGMGNINIFFFAHQVHEENDELSKKNPHEAQMAVGLCDYLVQNGTRQKDITILTFYTGQARELRKWLGRSNRLNKEPGNRIRVATVDSFQGEENEVIVLSLCRSNGIGSIGFLNVANRVCVAISRAKCGFYMFGDAGLLSQVSALWWDVLTILRKRTPSLIGTQLPVTCKNHRRVTPIEHVSDWLEINGGCKSLCGGKLNCGHTCTLRCHPYDHTLVRCAEPCTKLLQCGHRCRKDCWESCGHCPVCPRKPSVIHYEPNPNSHMDRLSERLAEVKTTDMIPTPLNPVSPVSPRKRNVNAPENPSKGVTRPVLVFEDDIAQPAVNRAQKEVAVGPALTRTAAIQPSTALKQESIKKENSKKSATTQHPSAVRGQDARYDSAYPPLGMTKEQAAQVLTFKEDVKPAVSGQKGTTKSGVSQPSTTKTKQNSPIMTFDDDDRELPRAQKKVNKDTKSFKPIPRSKLTKAQMDEIITFDDDTESENDTPPQAPQTNALPPPLTSIGDRIVQAIVSQGMQGNPKDTALLNNIPSVLAQNNTEKINAEQAQQANTGGYDMDKLKEFVQQQLISLMVADNKTNTITEEVAEKPLEDKKPVVKEEPAEDLLISFDDEPITKTLAEAGNGFVTFDMNKVLLPTQIVKDKSGKGGETIRVTKGKELMEEK